MNEVERLITTFRSENTSALSDPDKDSIKDKIISDLEEHSSDPTVLKFYLEVAAEKNEYDLARIEVLKVLYVRPTSDNKEQSQIGRVIAEILLKDMDDDVRNYAAIAASSYMTVRSVVDAVEHMLRDPQANPDLRANAFAAFKSAGPSPRNIQAIRAVIEDTQFQQSARRVLREWGY